MPFLDRFDVVRPAEESRYTRFVIDGQLVGLTQPDFAKALLSVGSVFRLEGRDLVLDDQVKGFQARTKAVRDVLLSLRDQGLVPDWRGEDYAVLPRWGAEPFLAVERAAAGLFGFRAYGVHLNGLVKKDSGLFMWIGKRAKDKAVAPGKLDQLVAGGQPFGLSIMENLVKECAEEANMPEALARQAQSVGAITYRTEYQPLGLRWDTLFTFDIFLDDDFTPENTDGELESFSLMAIDDVIALVRDTDDFKFNCSLVIIDFLIRWGYIGPEEPDYLKIIDALHG